MPIEIKINTMIINEFELKVYPVKFQMIWKRSLKSRKRKFPH